MKGNDYAIYLHQTLIGYAKDVGDNMPNTGGRFEPAPDFESVRELFKSEHEYLRTGDSEKRRQVMNKLFGMGLRMMRQSTGEVIQSLPDIMPGPSFQGLLAYMHINDDKVWWRRI